MPPAREPPLPSERLWPYRLVVLLCALAVGVGLWVERDRARTRVARADRALAEALAVRAAQREFHGRTGAYGWLAELVEAGLLPGRTLHKDAQGPHLEAGGYRIEVLLPMRGGQGTEQVPLVGQGEGVVDRALRRRHFAVVARPGGPEPRGYRTFYVDEGEALWVSEGVSDEEGYARNPRPVVLLSRSDGHDLTGLVWSRRPLPAAP